METKKTLERIEKFRYILILEGIAVGVLSGFTVSLFRTLITKLEAFRGSVTEGGFGIMPALFFIAAYIIICLCLRYEKNCSGSGIPQVKGELSGQIKTVWYKILIAKIVGGACAIGAGLSVGREGPSVQIGAMTAKGFSRLTGRLRTEERLLLTAGAGAGLSAAFNAPLAGVVFAIEEVHKNLSLDLMLASMGSCIASDFVSSYIFGLKPVFNVSPAHILPLKSYWLLIVFGIIIGLFGVVYNLSIKAVQKAYSHIPSLWIKIAIPVIFAAVLCYVYPYVLGGGSSLVDMLAHENWTLKALMILLAVKYIFSMISFGSGTPGGIFLPLLVLGAITGSIFAAATGNEEYIENFIILGMAGYFTAIVRSPITGIILISEMTGSLSHLLSLSLVCLVAYIVADALKAKPIYDQLLENILPGKPVKNNRKVMLESYIQEGSPMENCTLSDLALPAGVLVISIERNGNEIVPSGDTKLKANDNLLILCNNSMVYEVQEHLRKNLRSIRGKTFTK